jgi:tRNA-dihydrouridine synthase 3
MRSGQKLKDNDDDAAEGRTDSRDRQHVVPQRSAEAEQQDKDKIPVSALGEPSTPSAAPAAEGADGQQPEPKKVRLSGAQKKHLARQKKEEQWQAKKAAKAAGEQVADGDEQGSGRKSGKGQNKVSEHST